MALNLTKTVTEFLEERPEQKFTTREMATWILATYPNECRQKQQRSKATVSPLLTDADLVAQIAAEISSQGQRLLGSIAQIKTTEERPRKYYFSLLTDLDEVNTAETGQRAVSSQVPAQPVREQAIYPKLAEFLLLELNVYSKRIDEKNQATGRVREAINGFIRTWPVWKTSVQSGTKKLLIV